MAPEHVLRVARTDSKGDYILLNTTANGSSSLDLKLLATEGTAPFVKILKQSRISKYRSKSSPLDELQWQNLVRSTLLQQRTENSENLQDDSLEKFEIVASLDGDKLNIIFRKDISGIHQRLGELTLLKDESQEIDISEWASTAISRGDNLEHELQALQQKLNEQTATVQKLHDQLEDLIQSKKDHEELLFSKFAALLNEKKLKIRQQSQLLYTAKLDPNKVADLRKSSRTKTVPRTPHVSRTSKRKAPAIDSEEEESGFETRVQPSKEHESEQSNSEDRASTPPHSDLDATEDETENHDLSSMSAPPTAKGNATQKDSDERMKTVERTMEDLPPRRELPFKIVNGEGSGKAGTKDEERTEEKEDVEMENANGDEGKDTDDDDDVEDEDDEL